MIGNDETLQLVLTANDQATAILEKLRKQIVATGGAAGTGGKNTKGLGDEIDKLSDAKLVKSARAMSSIAYAADQAKLGGIGAARAMGELAENLALASGSAKFAGWAVGINAAILGMVTLVGLIRDSAEQTKPTELFMRRLSHITADQTKGEIAGLRAVRDSLIEQTAKDAGAGWWTRFNKMTSANLNTEKGRAVARQGGVDFEQLDHTNANFEELQRKSLIDLNEAERRRLLTLGDQTHEMEKQHDVELALGDVRLRSVKHQATSLELQRAEAIAAKKNADAQVETQFRFRDANGQIHKLTAAELAMKGGLLQNNRENLRLAIETSDATYKDQQETTKYSQDQTIWYATRRLSQNDYQTSLDGALRTYTDQLYTLQRSGKTAEDITAEADRLTQTYTLQVDLLKQMHDLQTSKLKAQNNVDTANTSMFGPGDAAEQHKARLDQIEEQRLAALKGNEDVNEVNRRAANERAAEQRRMVDQTRKDYQTIEDVLIASKSRQVKAIGHAAQTIRRLEIGAEAAHSAVLALKAGGQALAALGAGNFAGAAEYFAAAVQFGAAAALGGQESLGGGGSSGGGGAGTTSAATFEPRNNGTGGTAVINLYTTNPYGREQIQQVKYDLEQADIMRRPGIQIPPTTGIRVAS